MMPFSNVSDHPVNNASIRPIVLHLTRQKENELLALIIITAILSFLGAFLNILILLITWPRPTVNHKSGLNLLIFHCVAANLFMSFLNIPVSVFMIEARHAGYIIPNHVCNYVQATYGIGYAVVTWSEAGLAINRFIALFFPHSYKPWVHRSNMAIIVFAWLASCTSVLPRSFGYGGVMVLVPLGYCAGLPRGVLGSFCQALSAYLPYAIIGVGSCLIVWKTYYGALTSRNRAVQPGKGRQTSAAGTHTLSPAASQRRLKMAKMVLLMFLWGAVCNIPGTIIAGTFPALFEENPVSALWLRASLASQYVFTPCTMLLYNAEYRTRATRMLWRLRSRDASTGPTDFVLHSTVKKTHRCSNGATD